MGAACPLRFDDPGDVGRVRDVLSRASYTEGSALEALGIGSVCGFSAADVPRLLDAVGGASPLHTLLRLLLLGAPAEPESVRRAIAPMTLAQWAGLGLVEPRGESVAARVRLLPVDGLVVACDLPRWVVGRPSRDVVMGVGGSSLTLARAAVRRPSRLTMDLGTGTGYLALLAARHSARVLATDRSPRAAAFAAANARLNGIGNVDCLVGDLVEPLRGCEFDLIISNPPFVVSPESCWMARDGGMPDDSICRAIVRQAPRLLRAGGYCQLLCHCAHGADEGWRRRLAEWVDGTRCDALAIRARTLDTHAYAREWILPTEAEDPVEFRRRFAQWMACYGREGIEAISSALLTLRRRSGGATWLRADDAPATLLGPVGDYIVRAFQCRDFLEAHRHDESLMAQCLRTAPEASVSHTSGRAPDGSWATRSRVRLTKGFGYEEELDPGTAHLLARCDGTRPLRELLGAAGRAPRLDLVRRLIERGFLLPAGPRVA